MSSSRTTGLYDRCGDDVSLDEVRADCDLERRPAFTRWKTCSAGERDLPAARGFPAPPSGRDIPLDGNVSGMLPRLRHVVSKLHSQKVVHVGAERLFDAQGHFRRQRGLAVQKIGQRGAAHL